MQHGSDQITTAGRVERETIKTYASKLGDAFIDDDGRNNGFPILKWEKLIKK